MFMLGIVVTILIIVNDNEYEILVIISLLIFQTVI